MPLLGGDVRRKRPRASQEAHGSKSMSRSGNTRGQETGTGSMGLSCRLSKRQRRPTTSDPRNDSQSQRTFRRLKRAITMMKELERRVEEMAASSEAAKLEIARMRDEAIRARDEGKLAWDEAFKMRDEAEGIRAATLAAKDKASPMRDQTAGFRDYAERIYADVAAVKDDYEWQQGEFAVDGDTTRSTELSHWSDGDDLSEEYIPQPGNSISMTSNSVEEVETAYDVAPLAVDPDPDGATSSTPRIDAGNTGGVTSRDGYQDGEDIEGEEDGADDGEEEGAEAMTAGDGHCQNEDGMFSNRDAAGGDDGGMTYGGHEGGAEAVMPAAAHEESQVNFHTVDDGDVAGHDGGEKEVTPTATHDESPVNFHTVDDGDVAGHDGGD